MPNHVTTIQLVLFKVLKFCKWLIFSFFAIFTNASAKSSGLQWIVRFFEGLNFTNDQHQRYSRNLHTSKKTNYTVWDLRYQKVWSYNCILLSKVRNLNVNHSMKAYRSMKVYRINVLDCFVVTSDCWNSFSQEAGLWFHVLLKLKDQYDLCTICK